ncbi:hypothetical protein BDV98DRAFT_564286 [Pterulicium gracile]|uniref:Uncharacterized protein n=1 Tax=Pterulicium gracile TaxID=1884261 RepID=A0A5C3QNT9_9AGAR|nr:hypothetical protein BDV98DRAFT_564286 [Pterula gracilis]
MDAQPLAPLDRTARYLAIPLPNHGTAVPLLVYAPDSPCSINVTLPSLTLSRHRRRIGSSRVRGSHPTWLPALPPFHPCSLSPPNVPPSSFLHASLLVSINTLPIPSFLFFFSWMSSSYLKPTLPSGDLYLCCSFSQSCCSSLHSLLSLLAIPL